MAGDVKLADGNSAEPRMDFLGFLLSVFLMLLCYSPMFCSILVTVQIISIYLATVQLISKNLEIPIFKFPVLSCLP